MTRMRCASWLRRASFRWIPTYCSWKKVFPIFYFFFFSSFFPLGPSTREEMQLFVRTYLRDAFDVLGGLENLSQQLYCLIRKGGPISNAKIHQQSLDFLTQSFFYDVDGDRSLIDYKFTRRPLVVTSCSFLGIFFFFANKCETRLKRRRMQTRLCFSSLLIWRFLSCSWCLVLMCFQVQIRCSRTKHVAVQQSGRCGALCEQVHCKS